MSEWIEYDDESPLHIGNYRVSYNLTDDYFIAFYNGSEFIVDDKCIYPKYWVKKESHPWGDFLHARYQCMVWMRDKQKYSMKKIAQTLSMDAQHVESIFEAMKKIDRLGED